MTDNNTLAPTDAEILDTATDFRSQHMHGGTTFDAFDEIGFARAFLAKWGTPPAVTGEPVAIYHGRCTIDCGEHGHLDMELLKMIPAGSKLYTAPQPALASSEPAAVPASGPVGFDHKTAANFLNGKTVTDEEMRQFVAHSRWAHDDRDWLRNNIADLHREIAQRNAEIALLKTSLLDAESPTQAAQALDSVRVFWQQHTKSDALSMTMAELHADVELVIRAARGSAQAAPSNGALATLAQPVAWTLDAQRLTKASQDISTVLHVESMDLEIGSRKLLKETREAIDAAIAAQKGGAA